MIELCSLPNRNCGCRPARRWEHAGVLEAMQQRLDRQFDVVTIRRRTVEHVFGTFNHWMGSTPFQIRGLVATQIVATGQHWGAVTVAVWK